MVIKKSAKKFNLEFRKTLSTGIIAAFGFITALAWRDVILEYIDKIEIVSPLNGKIITALVVTFLSAIVIVLLTKIMPSNK